MSDAGGDVGDAADNDIGTDDAAGDGAEDAGEQGELEEFILRERLPEGFESAV